MTEARYAWVAWVALACTGCFRVSFTQAPTQAESQAYWQHHYLFGTIGTSELDLRDACPNGAATASWSNGILTTLTAVFTLGVYTPRELHVRCRTEP